MIMDSHTESIDKLSNEEKAFLEEASDAELCTVMGMESDIPPSEMQRQNDSFEYRF